METALAVDIGGTKLAAGLVTDAGEVVASATASSRVEDGDRLFSVLLALVDSVGGNGEVPGLRGNGVAVCGVGCGGPMSPAGETVSPLNIPAWRGFPLRARLAEATGLPTFVDNDAKALALGEGWVGAAAGCDDFIAMVVSTGVGGGIVLDGRLLDGEGGNAGHIGHVCVEPEGRICACGARGCLEAEASGTAIAAITGRPAAEAGPEVVARTGLGRWSGRPPSAGGGSATPFLARSPVQSTDERAKKPEVGGRRGPRRGAAAGAVAGGRRPGPAAGRARVVAALAAAAPP